MSYLSLLKQIAAFGLWCVDPLTTILIVNKSLITLPLDSFLQKAHCWLFSRGWDSVSIWHTVLLEKWLRYLSTSREIALPKLAHLPFCYRATFSEFAAKHAKDSRFKAIEKMKDREALFNEFVAAARKKEKEDSKTRGEKVRWFWFQWYDWWECEREGTKLVLCF